MDKREDFHLNGSKTPILSLPQISVDQGSEATVTHPKKTKFTRKSLQDSWPHMDALEKSLVKIVMTYQVPPGLPLSSNYTQEAKQVVLSKIRRKIVTNKEEVEHLLNIRIQKKSDAYSKYLKRRNSFHDSWKKITPLQTSLVEVVKQYTELRSIMSEKGEARSKNDIIRQIRLETIKDEKSTKEALDKMYEDLKGKVRLREQKKERVLPKVPSKRKATNQACDKNKVKNKKGGNSPSIQRPCSPPRCPPPLWIEEWTKRQRPPESSDSRPSILSFQNSGPPPLIQMIFPLENSGFLLHQNGEG